MPFLVWVCEVYIIVGTSFISRVSLVVIFNYFIFREP